MISRMLFSLILMPLVLSQPDLCKNPKLDSITYVSSQKIWFFTSGGYFWYVKENEFPPGPPKDKLPEGFIKGDAAFFCDFTKICGESVKTRQKIKRTDQILYLVEKVGDKNKIIEYDVRNHAWSKSSTHDMKSDSILGRTKIDDINGEIDAIFTKGQTEVYVIQKTKYAANDWINLCSGTESFAKAYDPESSDALQSPEGSYDAIAVKGEDMYSFIGPNFWKSTIVSSQSKNGKIVINKGGKQNVSSEFFKFKDCTAVVPDPAPPADPQSPGPDNGDGNGGDNGTGGPTLDPNPGKDPNPGSNPSTTESSGSGLVFLIVIIVVVLVVVALVIGVVVLVMRGKSEPEANKGKAQPTPSSKAKEPKPTKK